MGCASVDADSTVLTAVWILSTSTGCDCAETATRVKFTSKDCLLEPFSWDSIAQLAVSTRFCETLLKRIFFFLMLFSCLGGLLTNRFFKWNDMSFNCSHLSFSHCTRGLLLPLPHYHSLVTLHLQLRCIVYFHV